MRIWVDLLGVLAEVWMLYYLYENILERKVGPRWQVRVLYALTGVLFMLLSTYVAVPRIRTGLGFAIALLPLIVYQNRWREKLLTGLIYIAVQAGVEMATKAVFLSIYGSDQVSIAQRYGVGVLISKTLAFLAIYIMVSLFRVRARTLSPKLFLALLILPAATMITIYQFIDISYVLDTQESYLKLMAVSVLLIGANIAMCYLFGRMTEMEDMRRREGLSQLQIKLQQKQYAQLAAYQKDIQRMDHDRKRENHIIACYLEDGEVENALAYIQEKEEAINKERPTITGYSLIDSVLASKKALAQKKGIQLTCEAHWQPELPLPEADMAIILDNALDNALEATAKLTKRKKRQVRVIFSQKLPLLHMVIRNPVKQPVDTSQGFPHTTKKDVGNHGLGLGNMDKLARKHHGAMTYECENQTFILRVMVNISKHGIEAR